MNYTTCIFIFLVLAIGCSAFVYIRQTFELELFKVVAENERIRKQASYLETYKNETARTFSILNKELEVIKENFLKVPRIEQMEMETELEPGNEKIKELELGDNIQMSLENVSIDPIDDISEQEEFNLDNPMAMNEEIVNL